MTASRPPASALSRETGGGGDLAEQVLVRLRRARQRRRIMIATLSAAALALTGVAMFVMPASPARGIDTGDMVAALVLTALAGLGWIRS